MELYIIEGLDKTGKTTYMRDRFCNFKKIRLPGGYEYTQDLRKHFMEGFLPKEQLIHLIYGEHMATLEKLLKNRDNNYVLDRSFISFLVYQRDDLKEYGYYDIYKKLLEDKFDKIKDLYKTKILFFSKRLVQRKDDWLEYMDTDDLRVRFEELLNHEPYCSYVERVIPADYRKQK